jgi:hypothetical protein
MKALGPAARACYPQAAKTAFSVTARRLGKRQSSSGKAVLNSLLFAAAAAAAYPFARERLGLRLNERGL